MKVNEINEYGPIPTRFKKPSKSAIFDGKPADPKKVLLAFKKSLNHATEMNFKLKPILISNRGYVGEFRYDDWNTTSGEHSDKELVITLEVSWWRDGSKGKPTIVAKIHNSHDETKLFHYRIELDQKTVTTMWDSDEIIRTIYDYVTEEETYYDNDPDWEVED